MRLFQSYSFFLVLLFASCANEIETISITRNGSMEITIEGQAQPWQSKTFQMYPGPSVVIQNTLFRRYFLVFEGTNPENKSFELSIVIDLINEADMRHAYTPDYVLEKGGLNEVSLMVIEAINPTVYAIANLCEDDTSALFEIKRQSQTERLIAGTMQAELCAGDIRIGITKAEFKDIKY